MKRTIALLLVLVMCFSLAACTGTETPAAPAGETATQAAAPAAARTNTEAITIAIGGEPTSLDHQFAADDGMMRVITWNIYEPLVQLNGQTLEPECVLAESYEQIDDVTMEFKIREGVTFHDGDTLDAYDVEYSINRCLDPELNSQILSNIETFDHAEAIDANTVRIITKNPDPILITRVTLVPIFSKEFTETKSAIDMTTVANGTGPYSFVEWKAGDRITLKAFEGYWGEAPVIKDVTFRFIEEPLTMLSALQAGEIDLCTNMLPEYQEDIPQVISQVSNECFWIRFNQNGSSIFSSKEARLAAAYAVDNEAIADALFQGYATPCDGQMCRPGYTGYTEAIKDYGFDPDKAKELLAQSGYNGEELQLVYEQGRWLKDGEVAQTVAAQLQDAGFNVSLQLLSWSEWLNMLFDKERVPDLFFSSNGNDFFDADRPLSTCASSKGNQSATLPSEWDDKISAAQAEMDPAKRQAMYDEINQHFFEDPFALYLVGADVLYGGAPDLKWEARRDNEMLVKEISFAA